MIIRYFLYLFLLFIGISCASNKTDEEKNDVRLLPYSTGEVNNLALYLDPTYQNSPLKDSLLYHLNQPYLLTSVPAPVLDVFEYDFDRYINSSLARRANNLMVVNINEESRIAKHIKRQLGDEQINDALKDRSLALVRVLDVSARPQQVFYLLTNEYPSLDKTQVEELKDYIQSIIEETLKLDNERLVSSIANRRNQSLEATIEDEFGVKVWVPKDYDLIIKEENVMWLLRETDQLYSSIFVYRSNEHDNLSLKEKSLVLRDELGKYVTTNRENSYMVTHTSSKPFPIQREITIDDVPVVETRGLWEIENDFLGGGFVNYTLENKRNETISIDGFVFYSEDEVRRKMRDIDAIMSTVQIAEK